MEFTTILICIMCMYIMSSIIAWLALYSGGYIDTSGLKSALGMGSDDGSS
jgi:hypothetical protein